jgi:hypothetical protein
MWRSCVWTSQRLSERTAQVSELQVLKHKHLQELQELRHSLAQLPKLQQEHAELREHLRRSEAVRSTQRQYIATLDRKVQFLQEENMVHKNNR